MKMRDEEWGRNGEKNSRTICTDWLIMGSGAIFQILSQCVWISLLNLIVMRSIWCMYINVGSAVAIQNIVAPLPSGMSSILPTVNTLRRQLVNKIYPTHTQPFTQIHIQNSCIHSHRKGKTGELFAIFSSIWRGSSNDARIMGTISMAAKFHKVVNTA